MATYRGNGSNNTLVGSSGGDTLDGRGGNDTLDGRSGDDTLIGGDCADRLTGSLGADVFLYQGSAGGLSTRNAPDTILDFSQAQGDKISLAGLALTGVGAPGSLTWAGAAARPWGVWQGADMVRADTNGDGTADLSIRVQGAPALTATDFLGVSSGGGGGGGTPTPGFRMVLSDDFSRGYDGANWGNPFHGGTYWNGAFSWSAADVAVRGGELQVTMTRHADGSWTAGGLNSFKAGKSIHYGTVEFDARVEEAQGTMTAILMWPASDDHWPPEIDILETPHADVMHTLHWPGPGGEDRYDAVRNQAFDETGWRHYKMTWLPGLLRIEVDGAVRAEWRDHIPNEPMGFGAMGFVGSSRDTWMGGAPNGSTPGVVTIHLDNVVMAQWDGIGA